MTKKPVTTVLFLVPYPLRIAPSQRFRVEAFMPVLETSGVRHKIKSFWSEGAFRVLYQQGHFVQKFFGMIGGYFRRLYTVLFEAHFYSFIFIHREAAPLGPPFFEWMLAKIFRKKIIYDFDDAIWIPNTTSENKLARWLKSHWKVKFICQWADKVVCGNKYLCEYAKQFSSNVVFIPTCVDIERLYNKAKEHAAGNNVIGWTGSHSTTPYLNGLNDVLRKIEKENKAKFYVISNKAPRLSLEHMNYSDWKLDSEIDDLLRFDIGIMPMKKDEWSEGKCGFKLIQYLSLGIPAVTSPVGVNKNIVENGVNGFLCETDAEWESALKALLTDVELRKKMGEAGRKKIRDQFSIQSQQEKFLSLFR